MKIAIMILVTFFAGMGAGLGTGFAGMSAAAVITPMLVTFLGVDPYMAVGIALSSDVLASAVSAYIYGKNKNIDINHVINFLEEKLKNKINKKELDNLKTLDFDLVKSMIKEKIKSK